MAAGAARPAPQRPMAAVPPPDSALETPSGNRSPSIDLLAKAFVMVQIKLQPIVKRHTATTSQYTTNFANLSDILDEALPLLNEHSLGLGQFPGNDGAGHPTLDTYLMHTSGQFIMSPMLLMPARNDPQGQGSAITFARRYSACAILGIRTHDDDGLAGSDRQGSINGERQDPPPRQDRPPQRGQRNEPPPPPADGDPPKAEGWSDAVAERVAHAAVQQQVAQLKESIPEDHPDLAAIKEHKTKYGWPMVPDALAELSRMVAKAQPAPSAEPTTTDTPPQAPEAAQEPQNPPVAPNAQPEPPAASHAPEGGPVGEGVRVLPGGARIVPKTLCVWCEKPIANNEPLTPLIASESDPTDQRRWHAKCRAEWEETPADERQ